MYPAEVQASESHRCPGSLARVSKCSSMDNRHELGQVIWLLYGNDPCVSPIMASGKALQTGATRSLMMTVQAAFTSRVGTTVSGPSEPNSNHCAPQPSSSPGPQQLVSLPGQTQKHCLLLLQAHLFGREGRRLPEDVLGGTAPVLMLEKKHDVRSPL